MFDESDIIPRDENWFEERNFTAFEGFNGTTIFTREEITVIVRSEEVIHYRMGDSSVRSMMPVASAHSWPPQLVDETETALPEEKVRFYRCIDPALSPADAEIESFFIDPTDALLGNSNQRLIYVDVNRKDFLLWRNAAGKVFGTVEDPFRLPVGLAFELREHVLSAINSRRRQGLGFLNLNNGMIEFVEDARLGIDEDLRPVIPGYRNGFSQVTRYFPKIKDNEEGFTLVVQGASNYFENSVNKALEDIPKGLKDKLFKEIKTVKLNGSPRDGVKPKDLHKRPQGYDRDTDMMDGPSWVDTKSRQFTLNEFCLNSRGEMIHLGNPNAILTRFVHEAVQLLDLSYEMQERLKRVYEHDLVEIPKVLRKYGDDVKPESLGNLISRDAERIPSILKRIAKQENGAVARAAVLSEIVSILLTDDTNFAHGPDVLLDLFPNSRSVIERYLQSLE